MFEKFKKNKYIYMIVVSLGIIVFLISYNISISFFRDSEDGDLGLFGETRQTGSFKGSNLLISKDSNIKFMLNYKNCLDNIEFDEMLDDRIPIDGGSDNLLGLNQTEAEKILSEFGYKIDRFTKEEVVFVKHIDGYNYGIGSYFVGVKGENVVIYKNEADGKLAIAENTILNPKSENGAYLKVKDIENKGNLLKTFYEGHEDYQFLNIQEAIQYAQALCST
ncbi:MAG: hypothetical protein RSA29_08800 [Clostridium sp.]|uniref:hypothetical protein n=1 Tax=Clostridium sp. TaxID=1506 RepID=UPI003028B142